MGQEKFTVGGMTKTKEEEVFKEKMEDVKDKMIVFKDKIGNWGVSSFKKIAIFTKKTVGKVKDSVDAAKKDQEARASAGKPDPLKKFGNFFSKIGKKKSKDKTVRGKSAKANASAASSSAGDDTASGGAEVFALFDDDAEATKAAKEQQEADAERKRELSLRRHRVNGLSVGEILKLDALPANEMVLFRCAKTQNEEEEIDLMSSPAPKSPDDSSDEDELDRKFLVVTCQRLFMVKPLQSDRAKPKCFEVVQNVHLVQLSKITYTKKDKNLITIVLKKPRDGSAAQQISFRLVHSKKFIKTVQKRLKALRKGI